MAFDFLIARFICFIIVLDEGKQTSAFIVPSSFLYPVHCGEENNWLDPSTKSHALDWN